MFIITFLEPQIVRELRSHYHMQVWFLYQVPHRFIFQDYTPQQQLQWLREHAILQMDQRHAHWEQLIIHRFQQRWQKVFKENFFMKQIKGGPMFRSILCVAFLSAACFGQQQQQTPQEQITALVTYQAKLSSDIISTLSMIPTLIKQNQDLQKQVQDLQEQLKKKAEVKK